MFTQTEIKIINTVGLKTYIKKVSTFVDLKINSWLYSIRSERKNLFSPVAGSKELNKYIIFIYFIIIYASVSV